jgi:hypothetical protein
MVNNNDAKPFVKWAGGKRGIIETLEKKGFIANTPKCDQFDIKN